jgi:hypothetical protein
MVSSYLHGERRINRAAMSPASVSLGVQDLETPAKTYYRQCLQQQDMTLADFKGVTLDDLVVLEQVFS